MTDHDEEIVRTLRALGTAQVGEGVADRVLRRLQSDAAGDGKRGRSVWWGALLVPLAACLLVAVLAGRHGNKPLPARRVANVEAPAQSPAGQLPPRMQGSIGYGLPGSERRAAAVTGCRPSARPLMAASVSAPVLPRPDRGLADLPSMLAPPEPETRQERLLARVAQGRPDDFAMLNPAVQELVAQRREAEFFNFFPPPTLQEIYLAEHTPN